MNDSDINRIIVVLGAGRTGTSLLMQVLEKLKMTVSDVMTPPSEQNQLGGYEDSDVFAIQSEMLRTLKTSTLIPLPEDWLDYPELASKKKQLETIILNQISSAPTIWGVKDPRTVLFLPLWIQIFNALKVVPIYLLAVRAPGPTVRSLKKQYHQKEAISELFWLHKNCAALHHTGGNCFIVHYEDWFERPIEMAEMLLTYTGLDRHFTGNLTDVLESVIQPKLNRSEFDPYHVRNRYVQHLYDTLHDCSGDTFDSNRLMSVVGECQQAMDPFKGWYIEAQRHIARNENLRLSVGNLKENLAKVRQQAETLTMRIQKMEADNRRLTAEIENAQKNASRLTTKLKTAKDEADTFKTNLTDARQRTLQWQNEHAVLKKSLSFRLGNVLVLAFKFPGWKTLRLPYDLAMLLVKGFSGTKESTPPGLTHKSPKPMRQKPKGTVVTKPLMPTETPQEAALKHAQQKHTALMGQYQQASARISQLKSNGESDALTDAVLDAGRVLRQLKAVEEEITHLRIRFLNDR